MREIDKESRRALITFFAVLLAASVFIGLLFRDAPSAHTPTSEDLKEVKP